MASKTSDIKGGEKHIEKLKKLDVDTSIEGYSPAETKEENLLI